ncbi:MAG TPA: ATP synthase F1 subunit epsilon [Deltaproteobacteria bacterium]|nr:ATP synthase F1 subunit epsilon [Deltaproteobacteria bacterium]
MKIEIVTPYQHIVSDEAEEVLAVGPKGEMGILPGHAHYVTPLAIGRMVYRQGAKRHAFVVEGGYMEVFEEKVLVLADHVERAEEVDLAKAKQGLEKIDKEMTQGGADYEPFEVLLQRRTVEQTRIQVASERA